MKMIENLNTGVRFAATDRLIKLTKRRADLRVIEVEDGRDQPKTVSSSTGKPGKKKGKKKVGKKKVSKKTASKPAAKPNEGDGELTLAQQVTSLRGKDAIEELIQTNYGIDLDKRLTLDKLKEQALDIIAKAETKDGDGDGE